MQITYKNKVTLQSNPNIPDENKVTAKDMNEIKSAVNSNEEEQQALNMSVQEIAQNVVNNSQEISNIKEEQTTQNDNIQTNSNNISDLQSNKADKSEIPTDLSQLSNENTKFVNETGLENAILQEKTQRQNADNNLQNQIDAITASTDVIDIVGTYQDLQDYDTSKVKQNDVIKVLQDSTHNNAMSYYRWQNQWIYIGSEGPYYTIGQTDELLQGKANQSDLNQTNTNVTNLAGRVSNNESKIENIEQEQTTQNTNISNNTTNIESLQEENESLKKIVSQLPQVEGQGTEVTLENTIEAPFTIFDVEGNSDQETTEGRQLFNVTDYTNITLGNNGSASNAKTSNKITITTGSGSTASGSYITKGNLINYIKDYDSSQTYYVSMDVKTNRSLQLQIGVDTRPNFTVNTTARVLVETLINSNGLVIYSKENTAGDTIEITNIMISKSNNTEFEKYTNGASPNPNYEQPIYSAGDNIQLFDKTTVVTNKYINNQGEEVAGAGFDASDFISVNPNTNIVLSGNNFIQSTHGAKGAFYNINKEFVSYVNIAIGNNVYAVPNTARYFRFSLKPNDLDIIKVEKGNKASGYSPYGMGSINEKITNSDGTEEQDYSIFVQQPMRSIGDVRDCFVKKSDGWYERHMPYIASYNGETLPQDVYNEVDNVKYCNEKSMSTTGQFSIGASVQYIDENNWNDLPCTQAQIDVLENLPSTYKEMTIINSEDETPAYLEVNGIYDLNKLITRVEVIESEV